jgi:serine/threonine protein kinase
MNEVLSEASDYELDLIEKLLKFNPEDRLSAENALKHKYFSEME